MPFLVSIPGLGIFFRSENKELVKKNLMIFLRPKIMHDDLKGVCISTGKYEGMRAAQLDAYDRLEQVDYYPKDVAPAQQPIEIILPAPFG